jgi:N-acetylneuraminic acid mutarotase
MTELRSLSLLLISTVACSASEPVERSTDRPAEVAGTWTTAAPVPDARTEVSVVTDGERIWLIGGFAPPPGGGNALAPRAMHVYDPGADAWTTPDSIPEGVNHAGFAHVDGRLYIVGGFRGATFNPTDAVHIYDIASGTWSRGAPMPTPRGAIAVAVLDGRIHAIGGNAANAGSLGHEHGVGGDNSSVGTHEVYDPASDSWTRLAPVPTPRNHLGAATVRGRVHVVGGRVGGDFMLTAHEVWDPRTGTWSPAPPVPTGRSGIAVVALDERLYVFGGETMGGARQGTFDEAERFDPTVDAWHALPPMPTARHGLGAAVIGDAIHVLSGGPDPGFAFSTAHEVLRPGS